jgi:DNA-binding CsgD family transcriptional regulator
LVAEKPASASAHDEMLAFLREQFAHSIAGSGRLVLVSGAVASGKTQLLNRFLHEAAGTEALILSATGAPDEQRLRAGIIDQLFTNSALPAVVADQVAGIIPAAQSHGSDDRWADDHRHDAAATAVISEICHVLLRLARTQPVVIGVDDLQFADDSSVQLLLQLQRRIRSSRLLIVLNQIDRPGAAGRQLRGYFTRLPHHHLHLAPLSERAIHDLAIEALGADVSRILARQLHELSGGNPMLVNALIDDYRVGEGGGQPVVGAAFTHTVTTFLHRRDTALREVAGAVAVLGAHLGNDSVARLAGVSTDLAEDMMSVLSGAGLLVAGRYRHVKAASAALDSLSPVARARLHARAAELKQRQATAGDEVAAHLMAAGELPPAWSVEVLRRAAEHAVLSDEVEPAVQCLELALSVSTDTAARQAILGSLARVTWRVNPSAAASYLAALRQGGPDATPVDGEPLTLARHALWHGDDALFARAVDTLTRSSDALDAPTAAKLTLAAQWHFGPGGPRVDQDGGRPSRHTDPWRHTAAALAGIWTTGTSDVTTASAEQILRNCPLADTTLEALATAILALAGDNRTKRAEHWCAVLSEQAARRGAVTWQAMIDGIWSGIVLRRGDVADAVARARAALRLLGAQGWGVSICHPLTTLLLADTATGAFESAAATLQQPVPDAMFATLGGLRYLRARGQFRLATDRVLAAISDFQECRRLMARANLDHVCTLPWRSDLAEANLRLGNVAVARELAKQQIDVSADTDTYSRASSLRILGLISAPADRPALLAQAAEYFKRSGDLLELARKLKVPGQSHEPLRPLDRARTARIPGPRALRAVPAPSTRHGTGTELAESNTLSEAELRVAQLAALGQTNQQIGSRLFITVSTVEQHLTRVYRKLGIRGRGQLPAQLTSSA